MSSDGAALPRNAAVAVVGTGAMGAGIAQIAALAGHQVWLHDARTGAAETAIAGIRGTLDRQVNKGRLKAEVRDAAAANLKSAADLVELGDCALVVEAIVENLEAKCGLFQKLEALISTSAILASNTSSISITAIGAALNHPERLAGMHFFNPAPLMPLVEVISGAATSNEAAERVYATAKNWGKTPVHARSTPGFIVNRVARPFYAEGLRLLQEGVADHVTLDAVMRDSGGFRMGPFELMDLIGHDVNYSVTRSVFDAYYGDPRFAPSLIQLELINAGFLGRKRERGFYDYRDSAPRPDAFCEVPEQIPANVSINVSTALGAALAGRLKAAGQPFTICAQVGADDAPLARIDDVALYLTDGRTATERAAISGIPDIVLIDLMLDAASAKRAALACADQCSAQAWSAATGLLQAAGFIVSKLSDSPGLAVMRTVAMLVNEACDAVFQNVCTAEDADLAMRGGVGYPLGPLEWAERIGAGHVLQVIDQLARYYGEPRYRASPMLRRRQWTSGNLR